MSFFLKGFFVKEFILGLGFGKDILGIVIILE